MKIVQVTYTTTVTYAEQNIANIQTVMHDLRQLNNAGINYNACVGADGKTFVHTAFFTSGQQQQVLNNLPSFKFFQQQLTANGFEAPPKQELLTLVGSSTTILTV